MTSVPEAGVSRVVAESWCGVLHFDSLPPDANFFLLGGDSLTAVMIAAEVGDRLGVEIGLTDLVDAPTFEGFVERVVDVIQAGRA